ncbi:C2H2 finger domain transcription factor con7 [Coniochaeta pulveracea]|uniref:C2H2 finger domain transcription factor con7 n=1 Tax=Coniochaeta pulveracea TaxID=177199 RepID=A0A420XXW9_9PEZI|nr:C2H2 finger domain transcription factor con7 [Coniochaeta pulveracea]
MSVNSQPSQPPTSATNQTSPRPPSSRKQAGVKQSPESKVNTVLRSVNSSMERSAPEYSQQSDQAQQAAAAAAPPPPPPQQAYSTKQEAQQHANNYPTSATPTSEYGAIPQSARSSNFPEQHIPRPYYPASSHGGSTGGGMAQTPTNPSIAAPSPTYAPHPQQQYSPYAAPPQDMHQNYPHPGSAGPYLQARPDWTGYGAHPQHPGHLPPGQQHFPPHPNSGPQQRPNQVYSFVPIPGAQQHKRPRRRYEEIERMYKCGWNGCEKAYGTLNHLNAHVTMQAHGTKRTPEEFKEIRKEWKQRKKEEEVQRKAEEERQRQAQAAAQQNGEQAQPDGHQPPTSYPGPRQVQLPPIGYAPQQQSYPAPPPPGVQQPVQDYNGQHMYSGGYQPNSPYAGPNHQQMYSQHNGGPPSH